MAVPRGVARGHRVWREEDGDDSDDDLDVPPHLHNLVAAVQTRSALDNLDGGVDEPLEDGDTALHLACLYDHLPCVQLLQERGDNVEVKDEDGAIPLHDADGNLEFPPNKEQK
ncbi:PREDICTED: ankyrin repeat-containing protein P1E11.10-like [Tarenaya hassleriana]|uniref:ankyrin repeat-containing protein P1E11.10-like n=1 Tax=Tarenaya hassleriana TaxID=28532 RepID=UPI00053C6CC6|nr:PREDICTED: ankyrin repeat-containing protein P1E11.10-like [Tarenaya hassleriana]